MIDAIGSAHADLMEKLDAGDWNDELESQLKDAVEEFKVTDVSGKTMVRHVGDVRHPEAAQTAPPPQSGAVPHRARP